MTEQHALPVVVMKDETTKPLTSWFVVFVFFCILSVLTLVTVIYAKEAEQEAREVRTELRELSVTAQNRCIVQVILSYPPPVAQDEFATVLADFDACILRERAAASGD